jgi:hypothetical protein
MKLLNLAQIQQYAGNPLTELLPNHMGLPYPLADNKRAVT